MILNMLCAYVYVLICYWWPDHGLFEGEGTGYKYNRWVTLHNPSATATDSYLDMMVLLIGNRTVPVVVLGLLALWKDGEQLRFAGAFFLLKMIILFQDFFGAFCYFQTNGRRYGQGLASLFMHILCFVGLFSAI